VAESTVKVGRTKVKEEKEDWDFVDFRCGGVKSVDEPKCAFWDLFDRELQCADVGQRCHLPPASCHILILKSSYPLCTR
jgi:hypothetical protein